MMEDLAMKRHNTQVFEQTEVRIESFPVINLPDNNCDFDVHSQPRSVRVLPKTKNSKPTNKSFQRMTLPIIHSTPSLQLRPVSEYRVNRKYKSAKNVHRNSRTIMEEGFKQPRLVKEIYKISFPCSSRCTACAFTHCLGPVKVYVSQYSKPKPIYTDDIRDSQGRKVIPRDRRREFRGLVYDKDSNSLYPPIPKGYTSIYLNTSKRQHIIY